MEVLSCLREEEVAQLERIESQVELKCHADKFFDVWASKAHLISKITPNKVAKVELVEGDWDKVGAVCVRENSVVVRRCLWVLVGVCGCSSAWVFVDNNGETTLSSAKTRVEKLDFENRSLRYSIVDGQILQTYKTFTTNIQVTPKAEAEAEGCIMKLSYEYEKLNEGAPEPIMHKDLAFDIAKDIDAHLCSA
ncbi:MLP-like protein 43 [Chenopodium quinoa]|uniref:MLP-like protein 43 n=1 Tax=Chenopodium quinoa TaxID=63459 RepID=UPI000B7757D9|nr:MLP-like protein 43 [Chenopodium quinoa]